MSILTDYFRAPGVAAVQKVLAENGAASPVPSFFDGVELKNIDDAVVLAQLVAFAAEDPEDRDPTGSRLIWPQGGGEHNTEGPWVVILDDRTRDVLADISADRLPGLVARWAAIEEFGGLADPVELRAVLEPLIALAGRARDAGWSLFGWTSL